MCYAVIFMAIAAAASAYAASEAEDAEDEQYAGIQEQKKAAEEQRRLDEEILAEQRKQAEAQSRQATSERVLQANLEMGRLRAVAGESGLQGVSHTAILSEAAGNAATDLAMIENNRASANRQNDLEVRGANQRQRNSTAGLRSRAPSDLAAGLNVLSAGAGAYASTRSSRTPSSNSTTDIAT